MIENRSAYFVILLSGLVMADNVPVFIWGSLTNYTPAVALKSYNGDEFNDILREQLTPHTTTFIFAESGLSTEDLSQCRTPNGRTCFEGIQQIKNKIYLPSVEDPMSIIEDVAGLDKIEVNISSSGALIESLNSEGGKYIFVNFADNNDDDDTKSIKLTRHDQLITKLYSELSSQDDLQIMVIFTGKSNEHQKRVVRQATQSSSALSKDSALSNYSALSNDSGIFWNRKRVLLYYTGLNLRQESGNESIDVETVTVVVEEEALLTVEMVSGFNNFVFNITSGNNGYWWVKDFYWNGEALSVKTNISAVENMSFHCSPEIKFATRDRSVVISWEGLQIQPIFGNVSSNVSANVSFGDSWDCVGFVNPAIVGGLFVVTLLLFILFVGISCIMDINTIDRFDDPRGKPITICVDE